MDVMAEVGACCVAEVMGTELYTLTPDTVVASARRLAFDNGIDHLLVLENGTLAGIVCKDDLRFAARTALVSECMSSPVLCIAPDTTLREAAQIMIEQNVSCLPVVTGTFLVGMVTRDALATAGLGQEDRDQLPRDLRGVRIASRRSGAIRARAASRCARSAWAARRPTPSVAWRTRCRVDGLR